MTKITAEAVAEHLTQYGKEAEDIAEAYLALGITAADDAQDIAKEIEEAYAGQFDSAEEFAQDMADQTGAIENIENNRDWPHYCIDWEYAARELMMDYSEEGGYYFRNI
jgi:antirestriction protein